MSLCTDFTELFSLSQLNRVQSVLKYRNSLHELRVAAITAAATAARVGEQAKSAWQTTKTNFLLL